MPVVCVSRCNLTRTVCYSSVYRVDSLQNLDKGQKKSNNIQASRNNYTREKKSVWWEEKAEELQQAADKNDMKAFYNGLREVYGPQNRGTAQLLDEDGETVLTAGWQDSSVVECLPKD